MDMKQILEMAGKLREQLSEAQNQAGNARFTGESGGGMVKVVMNGRHEVRRVELDPSVTGSDREMLEDLVAAACNDATRRVGEAVQQHMAGAMGGMQLPPGMKLPF